jgi:hypothetical protein
MALTGRAIGSLSNGAEGDGDRRALDLSVRAGQRHRHCADLQRTLAEFVGQAQAHRFAAEIEADDLTDRDVREGPKLVGPRDGHRL